MSSLQEVMTDGYGVERSFQCHVHDDRNASASVNSLTGWWCCYACGARGKYNMEDLYEDPYQLKRALDHLQAKTRFVPKIYTESWLNAFDAIPGMYWRTRYKDRNIIRSHRLGEDPYNSYATIPMRDNAGRVLGVIKRDLTGTATRYEYPLHVVVGQHLYNYHRLAGETLLIVEGASDAIAAEEAGFIGATALYGSKMTRWQATLVARYAPRRILIATDQDEAGEAAHESVQRLLGEDYAIERLWWDTYKDLAAIPLSDRSDMLNHYTQNTPKKIRIAA